LYFLKQAGELEVMPTIFKDDVIERALISLMIMRG